MIPDFLKFIIVIAALAGAIYGGALALATFPPEQSDVIQPLPHEKLRQD
ncbi:MAG: histidine kinase [Phyllobacteriaceae bacterium]|nr:histidine kinase [Phyllobacteriaceae bacterium]